MSTLRRGTLLVLPLLTAISLLALVLPARAQDGEPFGVRLLEIPADRADDPRAQSWVVDHVAPGAMIERRFEVINGASSEVDVDLYATLASIDGDAFTAANGREQNELSGWITVEPAEMRLAAGETAEATLRIDVPADASEGERYAAVFAERAAAADVDAGSVGVAARVGIRVYLSVGAGGEPATDFQIAALTAETRTDGVRLVRAEVENTGGRALDFIGELALSDGPGGLSAGPFDVAPGTTLGVGETVGLEVVLDASIPAGPWQADLTLTSGTLVREASTQLTFPEDAGATGAPVVVEEAEEGGDLGLVLGLGLLLLVLLLLAFLLMRRRGRDAGSGAAAPPATPPEADGPKATPVQGTPTEAAPDGGSHPPAPGPPAMPPPATSAGGGSPDPASSTSAPSAGEAPSAPPAPLPAEPASSTPAPSVGGVPSAPPAPLPAEPASPAPAAPPAGGGSSAPPAPPSPPAGRAPSAPAAPPPPPASPRSARPSVPGAPPSVPGQGPAASPPPPPPPKG